MQKVNNHPERPERREPTHKELAYWQDVAAKRIRFAWATGIFGAMIGFLFHAVITVQPVWM